MIDIKNDETYTDMQVEYLRTLIKILIGGNEK